MGTEWYQMLTWLNKSGFQADIPALRRDFPEVSLTSLVREGVQDRRRVSRTVC